LGGAHRLIASEMAIQALNNRNTKLLRPRLTAMAILMAATSPNRTAKAITAERTRSSSARRLR